MGTEGKVADAEGLAADCTAREDVLFVMHVRVVVISYIKFRLVTCKVRLNRCRHLAMYENPRCP